MNIFQKLRSRLDVNNNWFNDEFTKLSSSTQIDIEFIEALESQLIMSDLGITTTSKIISQLNQNLTQKKIKNIDELRINLQNIMLDILGPVEVKLNPECESNPFVILMVGVNGTGKTTTIGKLSKYYAKKGYSVMLAAGDTFRAGAEKQLEKWADDNDISTIGQKTGSDPAAVIFDAYKSAKEKNIDILFADTAGRLQNQQTLMDELEKIKRVLRKQNPDAPHEIMLVLDASLGQNTLLQAEKFHQTLGITGLTITKLDGTAKGGILIAISEKLKIPIRFIGTGESVNDIQLFDRKQYVNALLNLNENE